MHVTTTSATALPLLGLLLTLLSTQAQLQFDPISPNPGESSVTLRWQGGHGPYLVETSTDLTHWSDIGEPGGTSTRTLPAFDRRSFYRVTDLDPAGAYGEPFGLIQTDQGEFGNLLGRHRLKTRFWLTRTQSPPHTSPSYTPAEYWGELLVNYQHLEDGRVRTWSGSLEDLGPVTTPTDERLRITWTRGSGPDLRSYSLTLEFPYPVNTPRTKPPVASDPTYELSCNYATAQPEFEWSAPGLSTTTTDSVGLVQMDPGNDPGNPDQSWWLRRYEVSKNGVRLDLHYFVGMPLYQGEPPWILKTFLFDRWISPTVGGGGSLPPFSTDSYFAQTLCPGHHDFVETVRIEPALDPAISEETRAALLQANIR